MKEILLMAIDLGTSFIKAGVYNTNSERVAESMAPVKDYRPEPGVFIQKGEELFESVIECMKSSARQQYHSALYLCSFPHWNGSEIRTEIYRVKIGSGDLRLGRKISILPQI